MRLVILLFATSLGVACSCPSTGDGGFDAGVDAGSAYADGGRIDATGGCYDRNGGRKFILYFEHPLCTAVSFRRFDGGFSPLFSDEVSAPEDYKIDDARVGLCSMPFEQPNGMLNQNALPLERFRGDVQWAVFQAGRPWTYSANGTLVFGGAEYWFSTPPEGAGITDPCREP